MNQPENAREMDESSEIGQSTMRGAAETAVPTGVLPSMPEPLVVPTRSHAPVEVQTSDDTIGIAISRPTPGPNWPLPGPTSYSDPGPYRPSHGPVAVPTFSDAGNYRPQPGRLQPPQRPPRPSRVPSIIAESQNYQYQLSTFQSSSQTTATPELSNLEARTAHVSRSATQSSLESIPDFPQPVPAAPSVSPRRSINLGPPPSSRRGASSFYSTASFVSPIPEEGSRIKSYASSAVIPKNFHNLSPISPVDPYFDESLAEDAMLSDDADDSHLVRSASMGKRGRPSLVTTRVVDRSPSIRQQHSPGNAQIRQSMSGTSHNNGEMSSSSSQNTSKEAGPSSLTANTMLTAFENASATNLSSGPRQPSPPKPSRLAGGRRPPRLDMDAIKAAEARGSLTSLPDLIRRATRLASIMDRGKRPASRLDNLDYPDDAYSRDPEKDGMYELDKHQSGLSDMLAAFPPPGSRHSMRHSLGSWPFPRVAGKAKEQRQGPDGTNKNRRRCCGLPLWGFLLVLFLIISVVIVAVVVPVELLVVKKKGTPQQVQTCLTQLTCANGGTSVFNQGTCSCICSSGFTGSDCTIPTNQGCTTIALVTADPSKDSKVTIGQAIPRLVLDAPANFSIPLDAAAIVTKFSAADLTCNAENSLVTFEGQWQDLLDNQGGKLRVGQAIAARDSSYRAEETGHRSATTVTVGGPSVTSRNAETVTELQMESTTSPLTSFTSTVRSSNSPIPTSKPTGFFNITEETVDFARVGVLYVLQEKTVSEASEAQSSIQKFLDTVSSKTTANEARNVTLGASNSINLVDFFVDVGHGLVGGGGRN